MDSPKDEYATALGGQRLDDGFDLPQRIARVQLPLKADVGLQKFEVGNAFEADDLVPSRIVDDKITGNREKIGASGSNRLPILRGISTGQNFGHRIFQLLRRGQDTPESSTQSCLMRQQSRFEPIQFRANPIHTSPLCVAF